MKPAAELKSEQKVTSLNFHVLNSPSLTGLSTPSETSTQNKVREIVKDKLMKQLKVVGCEESF